MASLTLENGKRWGVRGRSAAAQCVGSGQSGRGSPGLARLSADYQYRSKKRLTMKPSQIASSGAGVNQIYADQILSTAH